MYIFRHKAIAYLIGYSIKLWYAIWNKKISDSLYIWFIVVVWEKTLQSLMYARNTKS